MTKAKEHPARKETAELCATILQGKLAQADKRNLAMAETIRQIQVVLRRIQSRYADGTRANGLALEGLEISSDDAEKVLATDRNRTAEMVRLLEYVRRYNVGAIKAFLGFKTAVAAVLEAYYKAEGIQ